MARSIQQVGAAVVVGLVVLGVVAVTTSHGLDRLVNAMVSADRAQTRLRTIERAYSQISEAEAGSRGYVLTGEPRYLAAYEAARAALPQALHALHEQADDREAQRARIHALEPLVSRRLAVMHETVRLRDARGLPAAVAVVQSGRGLALMDSIRQAIDVAVREEEAVLARLTRGERAWAERVTAMIVVGVALTAMVGVLARVAIRRDIDAHEESQHALREAKEAAEAANRAKSDFLARMSHELRTPLNSVIGFSNVLLRQQSDALGATGRLYVERIRDNGMHLLLLIDDLLDISRIEVGRLNLAKQPVALDAVVREALTSFEEEARARGIALTAELPTQAAPVETDPARFRQVVVNLVGNAVKFTQQGRVTVRLHVDPATGVPLRLDVVDTGVGIPRDRQAAVFEAFEQADTGTARQFGGTGLGLAISRALCDALGYRLDLAWSEPGVGSAFAVALGAGAAAIPAPGPARPLDMATVPGSGTG